MRPNHPSPPLNALASASMLAAPSPHPMPEGPETRSINMKPCGILRHAWAPGTHKIQVCGKLRHARSSASRHGQTPRQTAACPLVRFTPHPNSAAYCGMPTRLLIRATLVHRCISTPLSRWKRGRG
jgi:hypothetical protein